MSTSDSIYDLFAGTYTLEVTDSLGCVIIFDFPLIEPAEILTSSVIPTTDYNGYNISCFGLNDGALQAIANGGVPNYSYYWNSIKLTDSIVNLVAGDYILTVYDKNNCESTSNITLIHPDSLYIDIVSFTDTCSKGVGRSEITTLEALVHIYINGIMVILAQLYQTLMKGHIMFWFKMLIYVKLLELMKY